MNDDVTIVTARTRFRRVGWSDVRRGDVVYYLWPFPGADKHAHGPATVDSPSNCSLVNDAGVSVPGLSLARLLVRLPDVPVTPH